MKRGVACAILYCALTMSAWADDQASDEPRNPPAQPFQPSHAVGSTHDCSLYYPSPSKRADESGYVFLGYDVGADGVILNIRLLGSSGFQRLDDAALACVRESWRNTPAMRDGVPVASPNHWAAVQFSLSWVPSEDGLFERGVAAETSGHFEEALAAFDAELARKPDSARAYRARAGAYEASGQHERALEDVAKANALSPPR